MRVSVLPLVASIVLVASFLAAPALATDQPYGWTLSASSIDPYDNSPAPTLGLRTYYLWLVCCDVPAYEDGTPRQQGMAAAEFGLELNGPTFIAFQHNCFDPGPPGAPGTILFACPGCPCGPVLIGTLLVLDFPGSICFVPSVASGTLGTVDCEPVPQLWGMDWIGIDTTGTAPPCSEGALCHKPISVDGTSWGRVKSIYR